jgi:hypothetical protein
MRINEIILENQVLDETTEQDQILRILAGEITEKIIKIFTDQESTLTNFSTFKDLGFISRKDRLTWLSGIYLDKLWLPQSQDPAINTLLKTVKVKLINDFDDDNQNSMGAFVRFDNGLKVIELYLMAIDQAASKLGEGVLDRLQSTLIHELTHALDDIKSNGKYSQTQSVASTPSTAQPGTPDHEQRYQNYLRLPHEVNARFSQALLDIAVAYHHVEGPQKLEQLIKNAFVKNKLEVVNDQQMKRLWTRAYMFFNAMQNSPKKVEPKSLAQRALAWITSQPTHTITDKTQ